MKRTHLLFLALAAVVALHVIVATARPPLAIKVEDVVRVLKAKPDPALKDFKSVGSDVDRVLVQLTGESKGDTVIRARAARALGLYPGPRTRSVLTETFSSKDVPVEVRTAAMAGLARAFKEAVLEELRPYLLDRDPGLRAGAATAMGWVGGAKARTLLLQTIDHEEVLEVRVAMEEALKRL